MKDLLVLAADRSIEAAIRGLLSRQQAMLISLSDFDVLTHPRRDPGCFREAHTFLRPLQRQYRHALVVFDQAWEGAPSRDAAALEEEVRQRLRENVLGTWGDVVVIDPELEAWVWGESRDVDRCLRWEGRTPPLRDWLRQAGLWEQDAAKPSDPKAALDRALREVHVPRSSAIFGNLARSVRFEGCSDPSFTRLRERLRGWFPIVPA